MQGRFARWALALGVVGAGASLLLLLRDRTARYDLVLASGSPTGEYYAFSQAFAEVISRNYPHIRVRVQATDGSPQNMALLRDREADLALVQSDTPVEPPVRAVALLFPEMFHLVVRQPANIATVADLRGKRVALMPEGSGSYALFWPLSQHYGLTPDDMTILPLAPAAAQSALNRGEVDALFQVITLGNPGMKDLLSQGDNALLAIDQVDALRLSLPYLQANTIPKGTYDGGIPIPATDLPVVAVNALLVAHEALPAEVVAQLTRALYEHRNELVSRYPRAAMIRLSTSGTDLGLPLHPGAEQVYRQNEPEFIVEYAEPIGLLLSMGVLAISSLWQLRLWLVGRQKNRADTYNLEILALIEQIQQADSLPVLHALQQDLFDILRQVVTDLDVDRISSESFESFTFPWEIAHALVRHQELILGQGPVPAATPSPDRPTPPIPKE